MEGKNAWHPYTAGAWDRILENMFEKGLHVYIYCAGAYGLRTYMLLRDCGVKVYSFSDRDKKKEGILLDGIPCISYEALLELAKEEICLIACKENGEELKEHFIRQGFPNVYLREDILEMVEMGMLEPYKVWNRYADLEESSLKIFEQFHEDYYNIDSQQAEIENHYDMNHMAERELMNILKNTRSRRQ